MPANNPIPLLLNIDVEPDARQVATNDPDAMRGFDWLLGFLSEERSRLQDALGSPARFIWYLRIDPQMADTMGSQDAIPRQYERALWELIGQGDEIGLHTHFYRRDARTGDWYVDDGDQNWVDDVIAAGFDAFERCFGRRCESFRVGDGFMNHATMMTIERLGARHELTPEPRMTPAVKASYPEPHTAEFPDCTGMPTEPYHPSASDWRVADPRRADGITVIPMSTGWLPWSLFPQSPWANAKRSLKRWLRFPVSEFCTHQTANLSCPHAWNTYIIGEILEKRSKPLVSVALRTKTPSSEREANLRATFDFLRNHPRRRELVFCTPRRALELHDG